MRNSFAIRCFALLLLAGWLGPIGCQPAVKEQEATSTATPSAPSHAATALRKDGEVIFEAQATRSVLAKIAVQVADNEEDRNRGLMHRAAIPDSTGMLFIFEQAGPQSFWMKNTAISLDIIFANENKEIVKIHAYTLPYAIDSYPSEKNAQYVVEVNGGFCEKHGIKEGDFIQFDLHKQ
jgi:uncharacterized protein